MKKLRVRIIAFLMVLSFVLVDMAPALTVSAAPAESASEVADEDENVAIPEDESSSEEVVLPEEESEMEEASEGVSESEEITEEASSDSESVSEEPESEEVTEEPVSEEVDEEPISEESVTEEAVPEEINGPLILVNSVEELDEGMDRGLNVAIAISAEFFPDELFRDCIQINFDENEDGLLDAAEIMEIVRLDVSRNAIKDLTGIEYLRYLTELNCDSIRIDSIDVSKNTRLERLYISNNYLEELDVTKNVMLKVLICESNCLTKLDVSKNTELETLAFSWNGLKEINLRNCKKLKTLYAYTTNLEKLDLSQNTELLYLDVISAKLKKLDITKNVNLIDVSCSNNPLTSLDISKCKMLESLDCSNTQIQKLDVSKNTELYSLICTRSDLQTLDVSKNLRLQKLNVDYTNISKLDVSRNSDLRQLKIDGTQIETLDLSANLELSSFSCGSCMLTSLDLTGNTKLSGKTYNSNYTIELDENNSFDLQNLPGDMDVSRVSAYEGCSVEGSVLTFSETALGRGYAIYTYRCSENADLRVKLYFDPCVIEVDESVSATYSQGKPCTPNVRVYFGNKELSKGIDYTLTYKNNVKAASEEDKKAPTVIVKGKGNYSFTKEIKFTIYPYSINDYPGPNRMLLELNDVHLKYNGKVQKGVPVVTFDGKKIPASEFEFEYPDQTPGAYTETGVYDIVIKGAGKNYEGSFTVKQYIEGSKSISKASVKFDKKSYPFNDRTGLTVPDEVTVKVGKEELKEGIDYTIAYANNTSAGKATAVITGIGEYSGEKKVTYQIAGQKLKTSDFVMLYTSVPFRNYEIGLYSGIHYETTLREGIDYMISSSKTLENVGTYKVTFKGIGGYTGSVTKTIKVTPLSVEGFSIEYEDSTDTYGYVSSGVQPKLIVRNSSNAKLLREGKDYTIVYQNNKKIADKNSGKAPQFYIKGIGNYTGTTANEPMKFSIVPANLQESTTISVENVLYKDKKNNFVPKYTITEAETGKKLAKGKDYAAIKYEYKLNGEYVEISNGKCPADAESLRITILGSDTTNFSDAISAEYNFYMSDISKAKVGAIENQVYVGRQIRPIPVVTMQVKEGKQTKTITLERGKDYVLEYGDNIKAGSGTVTIKGIGEYGGKKMVKFKIKSRK